MTTPCSAPLIQPDSRGGKKAHHLGKDSVVFIRENETWTFDEDSEGTVVINPLNRERATSREGPVTLTWSDLTEGEYYRGDCEESVKVLFLKDAPVDLKTNNCTIGSEPAVICSAEGARENLDYELALSSEKGGNNYLKTGQNSVTVLYGDLPEGTTDIKCRTRSVSWKGARYDVFYPQQHVHATLNTTYTCTTPPPITATPPTTHPNTPNTGSAVVTVAAVSSILGLVIAVVVIALLVAMVIWIRRLHRRGGRVGQEETADIADNNSHDEQHHH